MLIMLPNRVRQTEVGLGFVPALPLVPSFAPGGVEAVEIGTNGETYGVVKLTPAEVDEVHDTTKRAVKACTAAAQRVADRLEHGWWRTTHLHKALHAATNEPSLPQGPSLPQ